MLDKLVGLADSVYMFVFRCHDVLNGPAHFNPPSGMPLGTYKSLESCDLPYPVLGVIKRLANWVTVITKPGQVADAC